jgi:hypothetical protein
MTPSPTIAPLPQRAAAIEAALQAHGLDAAGGIAQGVHNAEDLWLPERGVIGLPPDWYKDLNYRARIVRESRSVLREMGLDLPDAIELRVWDTTADTRYMVLPHRPAHTQGWSEAQLAAIVGKDAMIGVARL